MNVKHGFSTINRLLGKKNKGHHLSKSTTNLNNISSHNYTYNSNNNNHIDTTTLSSHNHNNNNNSNNNSNNGNHHQLEQNRITPLPIATTNAPFEQTFRITVLLPKGQLYVARLGAKTKLQKLLEIVCENKQLDQDKYEFRHPVDSSQVFSCELTIGAVGLNEIRLCHKSEAYDNFNADDIIKLRHTGRDSLSSSEFSSRNSKHTLKTASPYSSTNSLNSIDSTGMNTNYRGQMVSLPPLPNSVRAFVPKQPPIAPARKKRAAPRPPSQNSIPEKEPLNGFDDEQNKAEESNRRSIITLKKDFHVSSPNLSAHSMEFTSLKLTDFHKSNMSVDCNGNTSNRQNNNTISDTIINTAKECNVPNGNLSNGHGYFQNGDSQSSINLNKNTSTNLKTRPASMSAININHEDLENGSYVENITSEGKNDRRSSSSTMNGSTETLKIPEPIPRKRIFANKKKAPAPPPRTLSNPTALPRNSTMTSEQETTKIEENVVICEKPKLNGTLPKGDQNQNVSETTNGNCVNNQTIKQKGKLSENKLHTNTNGFQISSSTHSNPILENSENCLKPTFESSSDEEEQIKVYNLKLGKTIVKTLSEHKTLEDLTVISSENHETMIRETNRLESPSGWDYTIPAPPNFADENSIANHTSNTIVNGSRTELCKMNSINSTSSSNVSDSSITTSRTTIEKITKNVNQKHEDVVDKNLTKIDATESVITSDIEDGYKGGKEKIECQENEIINNKIQTKSNKKENKIEPLTLNGNIENTQSVLITELNNILNGNKLDTIISKSTDDDEKIDSPKPSSLSNFKIQSYATNTEIEKDNEEIINGNHVQQNQNQFDCRNTKNVIENNEKIQEKQNITPDIQKLHTTEVYLTENILKKDKIISNNIELVNQHQNDEKISIQFENNVEKEMSLPVSLKSQNKNGSSQQPEEERLFKKRSNTPSNNTTPHLFKSRVNITRSDSFHSTQYSANNIENNNKNDIGGDSGMSLRSSSYVSLLNAQILEQNKTNLNRPFTDTQRRKSSSELSIGESPSLQSLIVMKSILNSHKNNLNIEKDFNGNLSRKDKKLTSYDDCDNSKENSPKNKIVSQRAEGITVNISDKKEEEFGTEKKWKYQGPPSINLTSWSERPKIQVSIKNDGDYKFGVGGGGIGGGSTSITTFPRVYRNSLNTNSIQYQQSEVKIGNSHQINHPVRIIAEQPKVPFVRSVEYKKPSTTSIDHPVKSSGGNNGGGGESNTIVYINPYNSSTATKTTTTNSVGTTTTMTLGRIPKINRTASFAPTVKGFRCSMPITTTTENGYHSLKTDATDGMLNENFENLNKTKLQQQKVNLQTWKNTANNLGRSNSIVTTYSTPKYSTQVNQNGHNSMNGIVIADDNNRNVEENPFSKIVLRKTGLKEKILSSSSSDDKTETQMKSSFKNLDDSNCAKLELKLTTTVSDKQNPKISKSSGTPTPPPPPPPVIRSVVTKHNKSSNKNGGGAINGSIQDPRDELLSAIRNFKKESLKRS